MSGKLSVRLDQDLLAELERSARASGVSESTLVREVLTEYLKREKRDGSLAVRMRTLGLGKKRKSRLPADLSTNPKYMEGFGRGK